MTQCLTGFISHRLYTMFQRELLKSFGALIRRENTSSRFYTLAKGALSRNMSCVTITGLDVHHIDSSKGQIQVGVSVKCPKLPILSQFLSPVFDSHEAKFCSSFI